MITKNIKMKYLFPNFLTSKLEYEICKNYWETKIEYLLQRYNIVNLEQYINTKFANGKEQYNGNPIVNYYIKSNSKAFRIVQNEPEVKTVEISAWTNKFQIDDLDITELVISLELTPESEQIAYDFIKKWLVNNYSASVMEKYIDYIYESVKSVGINDLTDEIYA